ncbi:MAG: hypothetical protein WD851_12265 [Pirellulales bacterium]
MATLKPTSCRLRTYQVGFGDCFLLTFRYPPTRAARSRDRHLLIDFGSTHIPETLRRGLSTKVPNHLKEKVKKLKSPITPSRYMTLIAEDIAHASNGKLHAVVATHRHKDHIDGFKPNASGTAAGNIIASLKPEVVLMPWTEDPNAKPDARTATQELSDDESFVRGLLGMQALAGAVAEQMAAMRKALLSRNAPSVRGALQLQFLGENNLSNRAAVENLLTMGRRKPRFLSFGKEAGLKTVLPGVDVDVLGPPTAEQSTAILNQRRTDPDEFWHLHADFWAIQGETGLAATGDDDEFFSKDTTTGLPPMHARWLASRLDQLNVDQTLQIVRILDRALNNTSLILLFRAGKKTLLFPGDAQIENWLYALTQSSISNAVRRALARTDFYKVGHHGSLNATPKSLWELFEKKSTDLTAADRLKSIVSTRSGVHGSPESGTEVPRRKLVAALKKHSHFASTQDSKKFCFDVEWDLP